VVRLNRFHGLITNKECICATNCTVRVIYVKCQCHCFAKFTFARLMNLEQFCAFSDLVLLVNVKLIVALWAYC